MPTCSSKVMLTVRGACCRRAPSAGCADHRRVRRGRARRASSAPPNSSAEQQQELPHATPAQTARPGWSWRRRGREAPRRQGRSSRSRASSSSSPTTAATWVSSRSAPTAPAAMSWIDSAPSTAMNVPSSGTSPAGAAGRQRGGEERGAEGEVPGGRLVRAVLGHRHADAVAERPPASAIAELHERRRPRAPGAARSRRRSTRRVGSTTRR